MAEGNNFQSPPLILSQMEAILNRRLTSEARHILKMQRLLDEYDCENRSLNRQVLQLLQENKTLRLDRMRSYGAGRTEPYSHRKQAEVDRRVEVELGLRQEKDGTARGQDVRKEKQEETAEKSPEGREKQRSSSPPEIMSFRAVREEEAERQAGGVRHSPNKQEQRRKSPSPEGKIAMPAETIPSAFLRMSQGRQPTPSRQTNSKTSIREELQVEVTEGNSRLEAERREEGRSRRSQSKHKLPPSPQITPSHSEAKLKSGSQLVSDRALPISEIALGGSPSPLPRRGQQSAGSGNERQSSEKRKKFIRMVSVSKLKELSFDPEGRGGC